MRSFLFVLLLVATLSKCGALETIQEYAFDFENGFPQELAIQRAEITTDPAEVISGNASLKIDTTRMETKESEVFPFLESTESIRLMPGHTYRISLKYRVLVLDTLQARVNLFIKSSSNTEPVQWVTSFHDREGVVSQIDGVFPIKQATDYKIIMTVRSSISVVIDDLTIRPTTGKAPGDGDPIKNISPGQDKDLEWLDDLRRKQGLDQILRETLITVLNNAGRSVTDFADKIITDLHPDISHWGILATGDTAAVKYGIRSTVGGQEYDFLFPSENEAAWKDRWSLFRDSGFQTSYENSFMTEESWVPGIYRMCHNGDNWHRTFLDSLLAQLRTYEGVSQDNIGCAAFVAPWHSRGCYCTSCLAKFRKWLGERYTAQELRKWGIEDLANFDFRERFVSVGRFGLEALEDPVAREYLKFQYRSNLDAWKDVVMNCKRLSVQDNRLIPVMGNQYGADGSWVYSTLLGQYNDVVEIEDVHDMYGRGIYRRSMTYKLGRASTFGRKPVWTRYGFPDPDHGDLEWPSNSRLLHEISWGEALANGGLHSIQFEEQAYHIEKPSWTDWPKQDSRQRYEFYKKWAELLHHNRAAFTRAESTAKVAVVWSLPSMIWHDFPSFGIEAGWGFDPPPFWAKDNLKPNQVPYRLHYGTTALLDEMHIQHDFLMFGHPEFLSDEALNLLHKYEVVIMPYCPCLSDVQAKALKEFVKRGGVIIKIGEIGIRDENYNLRSKPALDGTPMVDLLSENTEACKLLRRKTDLITDASPRVSINLWRIMDGRGLIAHLVNYDAEDVWRDKARPTRPIKISFPIPKGTEINSAIMLTMMGGRRNIPYEVHDGRVVCTVPSFDAYTAIAFVKRAAYEAANKAAIERRQKDQEYVKSERLRLRELYGMKSDS